MKVFCYFVEPASYTIDLIKNVHQIRGISFCFIKGKSEAKSNTKIDAVFLSEKSLFEKLQFVYKQWKNNSLIVVNGYNNLPFILTFLLNFFASKKKYIATESDTKLRVPSNPVKRIVKSIFLQLIFGNKFVLGFAGGSKTHKDLFRYFGMQESRIFLLPMMIDNQKFYHEKVLPSTFTFLFVGRLLKTKNVDVLCKKFISSFSDKNAKLVIVGGGEYLEQYKLLYENEKVEFKGKVFGEELIEIYQNASVFIFPSTWEQWGLVVNEALSAALPVIAHSEVGAVYDLVLEKNTGSVINNWEELEKQMLIFYNDEKLLKESSENAGKLMKEYWNYDLYNQCLTDAIKRVEQW